MTEQYADLDSSKEKVIDAQYQLNQYKIQVQAKQAALKQAQAALDKAKLNLSYTEIRAPIDGMIGQKSANVGNFVGAGNPLMVVVPLDQVYVEANFREIELKQIKIGQPVTVYVDAYNVELKGVVDSFSPSTGAFSRQFQQQMRRVTLLKLFSVYLYASNSLRTNLILNCCVLVYLLWFLWIRLKINLRMLV